MKKWFKLLIAFGLSFSLFACSNSEVEKEEEVKEVEKVEPVIENEIVRVELINPLVDEGGSYYNYEIENLTSQDIILNQSFRIAPKEKWENKASRNVDGVDNNTLRIGDDDNNLLCLVQYEVSLNDDAEFTGFKILQNEVTGAVGRIGLPADSITIEQISDSAVDNYGKDECGDSYQTLLTLRITNNSEYVVNVWIESINVVLEPKESIEQEIGAKDEVPSDYPRACTVAKDLPFDLSVRFGKHNIENNVIDGEVTETTFRVTH